MTGLINKAKLFLILSTFVVSGCENGDDVLKGDLKGRSITYSLEEPGGYDSIPGNNAGTKVNISNDEVDRTVTTDSNGIYRFEDLPTGAYDIIFTRDSFTTYKRFGYTHVGGSMSFIEDDAMIYEKSRFSIDSLKVDNVYLSFGTTWKMEGDLGLSGTVDTMGAYFYARYYMHNQKNVSYKNYSKTGLAALLDDNLIMELSFQEYNRGDTLYMVMYPSRQSDYTYQDVNSGSEIYCAINKENPSNVVSFTLPEKE